LRALGKFFRLLKNDEYTTEGELLSEGKTPDGKKYTGTKMTL
jgi:hypothetical protein